MAIVLDIIRYVVCFVIFALVVEDPVINALHAKSFWVVIGAFICLSFISRYLLLKSENRYSRALGYAILSLVILCFCGVCYSARFQTFLCGLMNMEPFFPHVSKITLGQWAGIICLNGVAGWFLNSVYKAIDGDDSDVESTEENNNSNKEENE
jgi:hypothetical protein